MTEQEEKVARTLLAIAKRHNKGYCFASQPTLQYLLILYQHWNMSERTLRRRLKGLEEKGFIKITHRNWSEVNGSKRFRCNMYTFTKKLFLWFAKMGEYVRKLFSFFRRPILANNSFLKPTRDLEKTSVDVEILWKSDIKSRASPSKASY